MRESSRVNDKKEDVPGNGNGNVNNNDNNNDIINNTTITVLKTYSHRPIGSRVDILYIYWLVFDTYLQI